MIPGSARLAAMSKTALSDVEQGRCPLSRAQTAAFQRMTANGCPSATEDAGGDDPPERGIVQEPAVGDDQVGGRGVGEHPGGGAPEQGGEPPGGEGLGVHRSAFPPSWSRLSSRADRRSRAAMAALSAPETSPR